MFGGIRPGGKVLLLSSGNVGLAVNAFASAFVYISMRAGLVKLLCDYFAFENAAAIERLVELPSCFAFVVGIIADCYPLGGSRRRAYMLLGLLLSLTSLTVLAFAVLYKEPFQHHFGRAFTPMVISTMALVSFGSMINFLSVHTAIVTLSQQERLQERGVVQANYLIARVYGALVARVIMFAITQMETLPQAELGVLCVLTSVTCGIVFAILYVDDPEIDECFPFRESWGEYWRLTQQKAVWRILCFISAFTVCSTFQIGDAQRLLAKWSNLRGDNSKLASGVVVEAVTIITLCIWRARFINTLWRRVFAVGPLSSIATQMTIAVIIAFGILRNEWFFTLASGFMGISAAISALAVIVPVTEIAHEDTEGGMVGLALSAAALFKIATNTISATLDGHTFVPTIESDHDSSHDRWMVVIAVLVACAITALALLSLVGLPMQKLDAQQLRTFGGFSRSAGYATALVYVLLLLYCVVHNSWMFSQ